jgi:cob(I)alamin adenosyltransferase
MYQASEESFSTERDVKLKKGYVQVYTGNGKGKTTAAIGLAVRAVGAGLKVYIAQFMKNGHSSELKCLTKLTDQITIESFLAQDSYAVANPDNRHETKGWQTRIKNIFHSRGFDMAILEEANMAVMCGLASPQDILSLLAAKPPSMELVITGRYAHPKIIEKADLVTDMQEVKHYYRNGVKARAGIEQ